MGLWVRGGSLGQGVGLWVRVVVTAVDGTQCLEDAQSTQGAILFPALNVYIIYVVTMETLSPARTALPCVFEARSTPPLHELAPDCGANAP